MLFGLLISVSALAQDREISGRILDETKTPVFGATILLKGTSKGTTTDFDGKFKMKIPDNPDGVLLIRYIGYNPQELVVGTKTTFNVNLAEDVKSTDEVVVTGFVTQRQIDKVSNVSTIKEEDIKKAIVPSFDAAMQGRAPGLQVTQSSGIAGSAVNVRIRGNTSISAASEPLYVVDGVPIVSGAGGDGGGGIGGINVGFQNNPMASINPNDIESIEILKDAAATAQYGARGSNGVILVTTKKGKAGKTKFTVNLYRGMTEPTNRLKLLNGSQYLQVTDSAFKNSFRGNANNNLRDVASVNKDLYLTTPQLSGLDREIAERTNTDWMNMLLRTARLQEASLNASGGTSRTQYFISGTYRDEEGVMVGNRFQRYGARLNLTNSATDKLQVGIKSTLGYTINNQVPSGNATGLGGFGAANFRSLPIAPVLWSDARQGSNLFPFNPYFNAYDFFAGTNIALTQNNDFALLKEEIFRNTSNIFASYRIMPFLTYRLELGLDFYNQLNYNYSSRFLRKSQFERDIPMSSVTDSRVFFDNRIVSNMLDYKKLYSEKDELTVTVAQQYQRTNSFNNGVSVEDLPNDATRSIESGARQIGRSGNESYFAFLSYMAIANLKLKDKYIAQASIRTDGSSRFGNKRRYGTFPSLGLGWIASEESVIKDIKEISFLKVKGSAGITGNAAGLDNFQSFGLYQTGATYNFQPGTRPKQIANPDLTWEKTFQTDLSVEWGLFKDRITGSFGYYNKYTYDLLLALPLPPSAGLENNLLQNIGRMRNRGFEIEIGTKNITKSKFSWSTDFNITFNKNVLLNIGGLEFNEIANSLDIGNFTGQQVSTFYLPTWAGVDPNTGEELIFRAERDAAGNLTGKLTDEKFRPSTLGAIDSNRVPIFDKRIFPKFFGGLNNKITFGNFDFSFLFTYTYGNYVLDQGERRQSYFTGANNLRENALTAWNVSNSGSQYPKLYYNGATNALNLNDQLGDPGIPRYIIDDPYRFRNTTRFLHDASYIRLRTVSFAYTLPQKVAQRMKLDNVRFYCNAQNLFVLTKFPGWDPEVVGNLNSNIERNLRQGITDLDFPQVRSIIVGFTTSF